MVWECPLWGVLGAESAGHGKSCHGSGVCVSVAWAPLGAVPQFGGSRAWHLLELLLTAGLQRWLEPLEGVPVAEGVAQVMTWAAGPAGPWSLAVGLALRQLHRVPVGSS